MWNKQRYCWQLQNHVWIQNFRGEQPKNRHARKTRVSLRGLMTWKVMPRNVWNDVASWQTGRLNNSTKYQLHALMTIIAKKTNWNLWENCQKYALKLFWNAYTWHVLEDLIFYFQWTHLHDRSRNGRKPATNDHLVWSLTFIIHVNTNSIAMWETLPNNECRLGLFQDSDFAGDLEDSKSTSGGTLCIFGSHTFVPICWMCKKQTSVSHSSTESEIISLDAGLRLDGFPALDLWDLIVAVLHGNTYQSNQARRYLCTNQREVRAIPHTLQKRKNSHGMIDDLDNVDFISSNVNSSRQEALFYVFEDNEAVIKMMIKGRSPTMRHVFRNHRVALDWLFDGINLDPKIQIKYIDTKNQLADILTKGNFTRDEWNHLLCLFNISHFSSINNLEAMSKRTKEGAGEERVTAKSKPMMNLVSRCSERTLDVLASTLWKMILDLLPYSLNTSTTNDGRKGHGYHLLTARVFRTSRGCSICSYPGKNGRCSKIIENSNIGMSRHLDSSTTTQMAKIMVQYGRSSCSFWKEFVRSSFGRTIMGKAIWEILLQHGWEKVSNCECLFVHREKGLFLSVCVDDLKMAGK